MKKKASPYYVYLLECGDSTLYTGITTDIGRRLAEHEQGRGARYTRSRKVARIVYTERAASRSAALRREAEIKRLKRSQKLALIEKS